jgi:AcrR family transcriptional regulator
MFPLCRFSYTFASNMEFNQKQNLIIKIGEVIMTYGARSVNMDDIAKHLSISKKTLYKHFKDKSEIINEIVILHMHMEDVMISSIVENSVNAIDEMIQISQFVNEKLKKMHPSVMFDLQKYYPESYQIFEKHKEEISKCIILNLNRGIEEGLYRSNQNPEVITTLYLASIENIWDTEKFPPTKYSFSQIHTELIRYHVRGIASEKGIVYLQERIKKELLNL